MLATHSPSINYRNLFPLLGILILAMIVAAMLCTDITHVVVNGRSHAVERHGMIAEMTRNCLDSNGPVQVWKNYDTNRYFRVCMFDMFSWGGQVVNRKGEEITVVAPYPSLQAIEAYLERVGYVLLQ